MAEMSSMNTISSETLLLLAKFLFMMTIVTSLLMLNAYESKMNNQNLSTQRNSVLELLHFIWNENCFFCTYSVLFEKRHPDRNKDLLIVRTLSFRYDMLLKCHERRDA